MGRGASTARMGSSALRRTARSVALRGKTGPWVGSVGELSTASRTGSNAGMARDPASIPICTTLIITRPLPLLQPPLQIPCRTLPFHSSGQLHILARQKNIRPRTFSHCVLARILSRLCANARLYLDVSLSCSRNIVSQCLQPVSHPP